jgi:hypothetical protein
MNDSAPAIATFLGSPVVGGIAGFVFMQETCTPIPGSSSGGLTFQSSEICSMSFNETIGVVLTLIGWAIAGIWLAITIYGEHQDSRGSAPG